jgi:hypothetical protein
MADTTRPRTGGALHDKTTTPGGMHDKPAAPRGKTASARNQTAPARDKTAPTRNTVALEIAKTPPASGPQFVRWVYETYRDQLHLSEAEGSRKFHEFLDTMGIETFPLSGAVRVQKYHIIKFGYPMRRAGYVSAVLTARVFVPGSTNRQIETHYAYAYWPRGEENKGEPEYICISPTFDSRDGEYRHRFIWYKQFLEGYDALASFLSPIEQGLLEAIGDDELGIDLNFYPGGDNGSRTPSGPVSYAESSRLGIKALAVALALDANRARDGNMQNHATPSYTTVMEALYARCASAFTSYSAETLDLLDVFVTGKSNQPLRAQCGQKLIPLTVREALQTNDINFAPWREVWVSQRVTDLVVNGVAPMFPIFNNWTYLEGVDRSLFENKAMHGRYDRSVKAEAVHEGLRLARAAAGDVDSDYRMSQLDAHVYDAIAYAQDNVLLTDLAMCTTSEYVGMTVRTVPDVARRSHTFSPSFLRMFADPALQARYLFDLCYGAHMLHTRVGAVHADLHLNNMTIFENDQQYVGKTSGDTVSYRARYVNPTIAYIAGPRGEADTYVFPHDGSFASLIDFSRAILGPAARPQITAESGEAFAAGFYRSQVSRTLRVLHHYIPGFVAKNQEKIKGLLLSDFDTMFLVLTAVDFLAIGRNYGALLREISTEKLREGDVCVLEVAPEGIALAARIEQIALEHLVVNLTELVSSKGGRREIEHAGDRVLPGAFDEFRYSAWDGDAALSKAEQDKTVRPYTLREATLTDVYNAAVPLKYSGSDYARYPPWAKFEDLERHLGGIKIAQVTADRGERPFLRSQNLDGYLEVLQEQVRRGLLDAPAAETSSWIAE